MPEENQKFKNPQPTVRFSANDIEFLNANFDKISGGDPKMTYSEFFLEAVSMAVGKATPKEVSKKEDLKKIEDLENRITEIQKLLNDNYLIVQNKDAEIEKLNKTISELTEHISTDDEFGFDLEEKEREYIEAVIVCSIRDKWCSTPEEWLIKVLTSFQQKFNNFVLTKEDMDYYQSLKKD